MSRANTRDLVGHVGRFRDIGIPCIYPDLMMRLTPNDSVRSDFLELVLSSPLVRRQIQARAVGTSASMVKISSAIVIDLEVRLPDLAEQDHILRIVSSADAALGAARHERKKRLALKQGLMEDLLTGRVRVKVGEGVVG